MTTEQVEAETLEVPGQEAPEGGATPAQETEAPAERTLADLQAQLADATKRAEKAEGDFKSIQGRNRPLEEMKGLMEEVSGRLDASERTTAALARAYGSGEPDGLSEEVQKIQLEASAQQGSRSLQQFSVRLSEEIAAALVDDNGDVILDALTAPELEQARQMWEDAAETGNRVGMSNALLEVNQVARRVEREKAKAALVTARKDGQNQATRARAREDADLDSGGGAGSTSGAADEIWAAYGRGDRPWSNEVHKAGLKLGATE